MALADDFQQVLDSLPADWTDLELDLRIADESRYVDTAVCAQPGQRPALLGSRLALAAAGRPQLRPRGRRRDGQGVLAKLDGEGVERRDELREVHEGRAEVVQMWGRPESVREEFRRRRSI